MEVILIVMGGLRQANPPAGIICGFALLLEVSFENLYKN